MTTRWRHLHTQRTVSLVIGSLFGSTSSFKCFLNAVLKFLPHGERQESIQQKPLCQHTGARVLRMQNLLSLERTHVWIKHTCGMRQLYHCGFLPINRSLTDLFSAQNMKSHLPVADQDPSRVTGLIGPAKSPFRTSLSCIHTS